MNGSTLRRGLEVLAVGIRTCPRSFAAGAAAAGLYASSVVAASWVLGRVTDRVILPALSEGRVAAASLAVGAAAIVAVAMVKAAGVFGRRFGAYVMQYDLQATFSRRVTDRYLAVPISWHGQHTTGVLLSGAHADVEAAWWTIAPLPMAVGGMVMFVVTAGFLVITDLLLAAVGLAVGPALAVVNWRYQRRMRTVAVAAQQLRAEVAERAHESFDGALVVKTLGREAAETASFATRSESLADRMIEAGRLRAAFDPVVEALPTTAIMVVLAVGAWRVEAGGLTAGEVVGVAYLFRLVAIPARVIGWMLGLFPRSVAGWERLQRLLGSGEPTSSGQPALSVDVAAHGAAPPEGAARSRMRHASFAAPRHSGEDHRRFGAGGSARRGARVVAEAVSYAHPPGARRADAAVADDGPVGRTSGGGGRSDAEDRPDGVSDATFAVPAGRTVAVVGPTGAGKSTLTGLLVRLFDPDSGVIRLDGTDLRTVDRAVLAGQVAIALQEAFLFDDTVRGNITLGADVDEATVREAAWVACADRFISRLPAGYDTRVGERGVSLSGGQRQRIALARAVARRPRLLVLDDATSNVDAVVEAVILDRLAATDLASTLVMVAYRPGVIQLADEVLYLEDGRLVAQGTHTELAAQLPRYAQLVRPRDLSDGHVTR